jgi:hypothetical protein
MKISGRFRRRPLYVLRDSLYPSNRAGLDTVKKKQILSSPGYELLFLGRPAQSLDAMVAMIPVSSERLYMRLYLY